MWIETDHRVIPSMGWLGTRRLITAIETAVLLYYAALARDPEEAAKQVRRKLKGLAWSIDPFKPVD
jgi:hypothetical protein